MLGQLCANVAASPTPIGWFFFHQNNPLSKPTGHILCIVYIDSLLPIDEFNKCQELADVFFIRL